MMRPVDLHFNYLEESDSDVEFTFGHFNLNFCKGSIILDQGLEKSNLFIIKDCPKELITNINLSHKNQVKYLFYDAPKKSMLIQSWSDNLSDTLFIEKYIEKKIGKPFLIWEKFTYLKPEVRKLFRDIMDYVVYVNSMGYELCDFSKSNLIVVDGEVNFLCVELKRIGRPDEVNRRNDIRKVGEVFQQLAPLNAEAEVKDYSHFLEKIEALPADKLKFNDAKVFYHHLFLQSPERVYAFLYNVGSDLRDKAMGNYLLNSGWSVLGSCENWNAKVQGIKYKPMLDEYVRAQRKGNPYVINGQLDRVNKSLLRFVRNCVYHAITNSNLEERKLTSGVMVLHAFTEELCLLHEHLCKNTEPEKWFI